MDLKKLVYEDIKDLEILNGVENLYELLVYTADTKMGDISLPCFSLAKLLKKSPIDIANKILEEFNNKFDTSETVSFVKKIEAVNGYLNFFLDKVQVYSIVFESKDNSIRNLGGGKTLFIDFSSLNLAKYMHIGHLSTTVIGDVIARIYSYIGYNVVRLNYVGDYGTPFGKMITAIKRWGNEDKIELEGVDYIQDLYVKFNVEADNDDTLMDEAREWFLKIEKGDSEATRIYNKIIKVSILEAQRLCDELSIPFDSWRGEAYYNDKMQPVIDELKSSGLLQPSEGAQIVDLSEYNLGACMIQKSDGGSLYATRDLAAVMDRYNTYNFDLGFYVTSVQQKLHFERWFKVLELMGRDYASNLKHITYGTYSLPTGKIGSRFGKQALVKDMLQLATEKAKEIVETRGTKVDDVEALSRAIGIGAIKFGVLKTERIKDCVFDLENSLNFDGETSPYIQYTYARCCSIVDKVEGLIIGGEKEDIDNFDTFELVKHLNSFENTIVDSANDLEPCYISRYLLQLCSLFNKYYNNYRIIEKDTVNVFRLNIVKKTREIIGIGLSLLGIETPNAM